MNVKSGQMEQKNRVLVLDFDHTCYDTDAFLLHEIREPMLNQFDIPVDKWELSYREAANIGYSPEQHFLELSKIMGPTSFSLEEILHFAESINFIKYLFQDVIPLLKEAKEKGYKIMILSFGNVDWQNKKVFGSGLDKVVDMIEYVTTDENKAKTEAIKKHIDNGSKVIFIDNKGSNLDEVYKVLPQVETYLISRIPESAMNFGSDDQVRIKYLESRAVAQAQSLAIHKRCSTFKEIIL